MRLIADGVVDRDGVPGLGGRLGYSPRQVGRVLAAEVGAGPLALARAQRARTARILVETTALPMGDIAFAAGFASIRQFNATMLEVYDTPPSVLRERAARPRDRGRRRGPGRPAPAGALRLRLPFRPPIDLEPDLRVSSRRAAVPGSRWPRRPSTRGRSASERSRGGSAADRARPRTGWSAARASPTCAMSPPAVQRCRRLLDLDADPVAISGFLAADPVLGPLARGCPGRRSVGAVDGDEIALRAVLGQQVSVGGRAAARRGRLAALHGAPFRPGVPDLGG